MAQAHRDLRHAQHALDDGDFEWACFAAHQAAEKAVKSVFQHEGATVLAGHSLRSLLMELRRGIRVP